MRDKYHFANILALLLQMALIIWATLALTLAMPQPVRADGPDLNSPVFELIRTGQQMAQTLSEQLPDDVQYAATWRYSPYGETWRQWVQSTNAWMTARGADPATATLVRYGNWGYGWWQPAQQQAQEVVANIQTQYGPWNPPDFQPGASAYYAHEKWPGYWTEELRRREAVWAAMVNYAVKLRQIKEASIGGLIQPVNDVYMQTYGGMYGTYGDVNN